MSQHSLRFTLLGALLLLGGCATTPPVAPADGQVDGGTDFDLLIGEFALARGEPDVALAHYLDASSRRNDAGLARRTTLIALGAGNEPIARIAADHWQALAPDDLENARYQAVLHARNDDVDAALSYLLQLADGESGITTGADLQMITSLLAAETNRWRAASLMAEIAARRPDHPEAWQGAALLALEADRPLEAEQFAGRALQLDPNAIDTVFLRARAQLEARPGRADVEKVLAPLAGMRHAADPGRRFRYAGLQVLAGRNAEADALYEDILVGDPDQHDARLARTLLALEEDRLEVAHSELHTLLERQGHVQEALFYLGVVAEQRGAFNEALDWYSRVSPEVPRWLDAQTAIGRLLLELEGVDALADFFAELKVIWPQAELPLTLQQAALLAQSGHAVRAMALLHDIPDSRAEIRWQKAVAAAEAGRIEQAESLLRALLEEDPRNPSFQNALGYLLVEQGERLDEAEQLLESAYQSAPANAAILDSLGWLRYRQQRLSEAEALLEESWQREPSVVTGIHLLTTLESIDSVAAADFRARLQGRFGHHMKMKVES